ncbi:cache domain-containing sensor histidine kinase [Paenibacillus flagellatus]|uniref:histidine kinase n=1 Tax=Paenibacillus flagellatus TaxID=2211139 RepID=A0A2V5JZ58_9BACL|nr:sensor histidine kinase [Paenibacillus flagellatus]PYI51582.1 hypothetical protein DLM86_24530 [Paenibacillus flagellatus]
MKAFPKIRRGFHNLRIKYKLLLSFGLLLSIAVGTISYVSYHKTSSMIEHNVVQATKSAFEQANQFIAYKLNNAKDLSGMLFMDESLNRILGKGGAGYALNDQLDDYGELQSIVRTAQNSRDVFSIRLYVNNAAIYARENMTFFDMADIRGEPWFADMMSNPDGIYCRPTYAYDFKDARGTRNLISCVRTLQLGGFEGRLLGVVSVDLLEETIRDIILQTGITRNGQVYLLDGAGNIISGPDAAQYGRSLASVRTLAGLTDDAGGTIDSTVSGNPSIVIHRKIEGTNWRLVAVIPEKEIAEQSRLLARDLLGVLLVVLLLAVGTAFWISEGITRRIVMLLRQIRKIEDERWDVRPPAGDGDEVGVLHDHLYRMSQTMQKLIQEKYQVEVSKKTAELRALQAQINPHFLYNTLDLIHWMALKQRAPDISDVVGRLAKFFRLSLSRGRDIITLGEELEHVRTYLDIQNRRFGDSIGQVYEIEPGIETCATVKIMLQPIVENAILHGIQEREDKRGTIRIAGRRDGGDIELVVEDDGVGMDRETLERIRRRDPGTGYGVHNVAEKIRLYYGDRYGIAYESEPGRGTRVTIRIPAVARSGAEAGDERS